MVTVKRAEAELSKKYAEFSGLSTDVKPTKYDNSIYRGLKIANGSVFEEMDTGDVYKFDEDNGTWILQPKSGGGGGNMALIDNSIEGRHIKQIETMEPVNLITDSTKITEGKYLDANGAEAVLGGFGFTDYIEVGGSTEYTIYLGDTGSGVIGMKGQFYDKDKVRIGSIVATQLISTITTPINCKYMRINVALNKRSNWLLKGTQSILGQTNINWLTVDSNNFGKDLHALKNRWRGKKANFLGDSTTFGFGTTIKYVDVVKNLVGLSEVRNYGISGTRIAKTTGDQTNYMAKRYTSMDNDADIVFVLGGTNDYGHTGNNAPDFGTFADRVDTTFYGALHVLYQGLIKKYLGKEIVIITPLHRHGVSANNLETEVNPKTGKPFKDYVNAIREVAEYYGLPVLDLYKTVPFNVEVADVVKTYMPDKLHPNEAGQTLMAEKIARFVSRL